MERRKLQQVGGGTYTVSVPKEWATEQALEAGAMIHLYTHSDGSLLVRTEAKDGDGLTRTRIEIDDGDPDVLSRSLRAAHALGFDTITLTTEEPFTEEQHQAADTATRDLLGMEVVDTGSDEITVQNLLDTDDFSVRQSVLQLQFIALGLLKRGTDAFLAADGEAATQLRAREGEADRLFRAVSRQFNRTQSSYRELDRLGHTRRELFEYYQTASDLREIAIASVEMGRVADRLSSPVPPVYADDIGDAADAAAELLDDAATAVLSETDLGAAHDVLDRHGALIDDIEAIERSLREPLPDDTVLSRSDACGLVRALQHLTRVVEHGGSIADVAIRRHAIA